MITIHKYVLDVTDVQEIETYWGAEFLCVQVQNGVPCIWAKVNTVNEKQKLTINTIGTGQHMDLSGKYIGTYQLIGGTLVYHIFYL